MTDKYIDYHSFHHPRVKVGTITHLCNRAEKICGEDKFENERNHLQEVFKANTYPPDLVRKTFYKHYNQRPCQPGEEAEEEWDILFLPYIGGVSE